MDEGEKVTFSKDEIRKNLIKYTYKAFQLIPKMNQPRILDIGCGSGIPTLELARLTDGEIIGIDIDNVALRSCKARISEAGFAERVKIIECSMSAMAFPDEHFNIIWSEGSIFVVGFECGLREWRRLIKPGGYLMVHDELKGLNQKLKFIPNSGYHLIDHFVLSMNDWEMDYFGPMWEYINNLDIEKITDPESLEQLKIAKQEIQLFKRDPESCASACFVIQKTDD